MEAIVREAVFARASCRTATAAIAAALVFLALAPTAPAAQVGAVADVTWGQPRADVDREIELLRQAGVKWIRANVNWAGLEADGKGVVNQWLLNEYDYAVDRAHAAGLKVLMPIADGVPYWASADPAKRVDGQGNRRWEVTYRPTRMSDYGDFARFVAEHFSARGVHAYQIWNEPNLDRFWPSGPSAAEYVPMLRAGYEAVKAVDPGATVVLGGLSKSDFYFLEAVYRAGGKPYFDVVSVHPYTYGVDPTVAWNGVHSWEDKRRISINAFPAVKEIRASMEAFGDGGKKVWLTEFGYSTTSRDGGVSPATQAAFLTKAFEYVEQLPWIEVLFWYAARNSPFMDDADSYEARFGLFTTDFQTKPSYDALREYAASSEDGRVSLRKNSHRKLRPVRGPRARIVLRGRVVLPPPLAARVSAAALESRRVIVVQRRTARGWARVTRVRTGPDGGFRAALLARGQRVRYRVLATYDDVTVQSRVLRVRLTR